MFQGLRAFLFGAVQWLSWLWGSEFSAEVFMVILAADGHISRADLGIRSWHEFLLRKCRFRV